MSNFYKDDSIETLSPRDHVRLRPGMYIGDASNPNHLLVEIFSNALDEHNIGHGDLITVSIDKDTGWVIVEDNGQGFPINVIRSEDGKTVLEASFSSMNTSGKFADNGVYEGTSLGLNGLGGKLTNFLSKEFSVLSYRDGQFEKVEFKDGFKTNQEMGEWKNSKKHGTVVSYLPDKQFFDSGITEEKFFEDFFNDITCLCPKLTVILNGKKIAHPNGIEELLPRKLRNAVEIVNNCLIINTNNDNGESLELAMTFTGWNYSKIIPYVNFGYTDAGPHISAIKSTITRVFNNWAKENKILKEKEKNLDGASIQEGMLLVCNIVSKNVAYNAQVKTEITKINSSFISATLGSELELWLDNNPEDGKAIIEKALIARKAYEAAKKAREAVKAKAEKKTKLKIASMPSKLADCHSKDRSRCELYLTEGDSASGGCKIIRDASFQAILGLRGKVLNCLTADMKRIQKNAEIIDIIKALGLQWAADGQSVIYNEKKLRYDKLIIAADKDPDGSHIQSLICTMLWALVPDLILDGHVYVALPPLYKAEWGKQYEYLDDKKALEEFKKKHKDFTLTYFKGLGEASPQELGMMIMDPKTRNVQQISVEDMGFASKTISDLMGNDTQAKKEFVFGHEIKEIV